MRFCKTPLLAFFLFIACADSLRAQNLFFKIDSLYNPVGNLTTTNSIVIYNNDTIYLYCHLLNNTSVVIDLRDTNLSFTGFNRDSGGAQLSVTSNLRYIDTAGNQNLAVGDSASFVLALINSSTDTLPDLLPTGSSVVIWPVYYNAVIDSALFTLYYAGTSAIGEVASMYTLIQCDNQNIYIQFSDARPRTLQLYDATGRKVYEGENNSNNDDIDWSALPSAVYILRIRQGDQSNTVKLVHF